MIYLLKNKVAFVSITLVSYVFFPLVANGSSSEDQKWARKHRLVSPNSKLGRAFDDYYRAIVLETDPEAKAHGIDHTDFYLLADEIPTAFYEFKKSKLLGKVVEKHIIAMSIGELRDYKYEEDLRWKLGHEWVHRMVFHTARQNSKTEEALADIAPFEALAKKGYSPNRALEYVRSMFGDSRQKDSRGNILGDWILDDHPLDHHRIKLMSQQVGRLSFEYGGFDDRRPTELPKFIKDLLQTKRHEIYVSYIDKFLPPDKWAKMNSDERIKELKAFLSQDHEKIDRWNYYDLSKLVREFMDDAKQSSRPEQERRKILNFVRNDLIPKIGESTYSYPGAIFYAIRSSKILDNKTAETFLYGPELFALIPLVNKFIEAKDASSAEDLANEIGVFVEEMNISRGLAELIWSEDLLPNFEFPEIEDYETLLQAVRQRKVDLPSVAWNDHVDWALGDESGIICDVLMTLGVQDQRLRLHTYYEGIAEGAIVLSQGPHSISHHSGELVINSQGQVEDILDLDGEHTLARRPKLKSDAESQEGYDQQIDIFGYQGQLRDYMIAVLDGEMTYDELQNEASVGKFAAVSDLYLAAMFKKKSDGASFFSSHDIFYKNPYLYALAYHDTLQSLYVYTDMTSSFLLPLPIENELVGMFEPIISDPEKKHLTPFLKDFFTRSRKPETSNKDWNSVPVNFSVGYTSSASSEEHTGSIQSTIQSLEQDTEPSDYPQSPLFNFLFEHGEKFLSLSELYTVANEWSLFRRNNARSEAAIDFFRKKHKYEKPVNQKEVLALLQSFYSKRRFKRHYRDLAMKELYDWMRARGSSRPLSVSFILKVIDVIGASSLKHYPSLVAKFRAIAGRIKKYPKTLKKLIPLWRSFHDAELFPYDGVAEGKVISAILDCIRETRDPNEKIVTLIDLLSTKQPISHPKARRKIIVGLAEAVFEVNGVDDDSEDYFDNARNQIGQWIEKVHMTVAVDMVETLADKLQAQARLSEYLRKATIDPYAKPENSKKLQDGSILGEWLLLQLEKRPQERKELIRFLASPASVEDCQRFGDVIRPYLTTKSDHMTGGEVPYTEYDLQSLSRSQYNNFWAFDLQVRVSLLDNFLFPEDNHTERDEQINLDKEMLEFAVDLTFPETSAYYQEARDFWYAYLPGLEDTQRGLFVAALLGGTRRTQELEVDSRLLVGMQLASVLDTMGPFENKLGQKIHSHSSTPKDIRDGMSKTKTLANPPSVSERHKMIDEILPREVKDRIIHRGALQGSGSFYIVLDVTMKDDSEYVLKVLRPYSSKKAATGFKRLKIMTDNLKPSITHNTYETLHEVIDHSWQLSLNEVDNQNSPELHRHLEDLYGFHIENLDLNRTLISRVVKVIDHGNGWALLEKAPGVDYVSLTDTQQKEYAGELSFLLLRNVLAGGMIATDRHGGQFRVHENGFNHFDPGGISLAEPTSEERSTVGEAIFSIVEAVSDSSTDSLPDTSSIIADHMQTLREQGRPSPYLNSVQMALLAGQDYLRHLTISDFKDIVTSLIQSGEVHPEIQEGFTRGFMGASVLSQAKVTGIFSDSLTSGSVCYRAFRN